MKNNYILLVLGIFFYGCPLIPDDHVIKNCNGSFFSFTIPVEFEPQDSIVKIGDTIFVKSEFPAMIWDDQSREKLYFDSIDFLMRGAIFRLDTTVNGQYKFLDLFDIIVDSVYNFKKNFSAFAFDFRYLNDKYDFSFKLVPKHKGIYIFKFYSEYELHFNNYTPPIIEGYNSKCKTDAWTVIFPVNKSDTHKELLNQIVDKEIKNWYLEHWSSIEYSEGGYLFEVE